MHSLVELVFDIEYNIDKGLILLKYNTFIKGFEDEECIQLINLDYVKVISTKFQEDVLIGIKRIISIDWSNGTNSSIFPVCKKSFEQFNKILSLFICD